MTRILIAGGPRTGKSTLAAELGNQHGIHPRSTDELIGRLDWSAASEEVSHWFEQPAPWIIEGVAVPRALRKWFRRTDAKSADEVYWLTQPMAFRSAHHVSMAKGCAKVWREVLPALRASGCLVTER